MGLYDTMAGAAKGMASPAAGVGVGGGNGGSFAQKMQQRANPMMQGRPAMSGGMNQQNGLQNAAAGLMNAYQNRANPTAGQVPGKNGSQLMQKERMMQLKNQQAAASGSPIGGSYGQMVSSNPQLEQYRNTGKQKGQDMSWMDQPGAIRMPDPNNQILSAVNKPQYGLQDVASRYAQEQQPIQQTPMQAAAEQMRGYEGPDLGSQDPRELARMGQIAGAGEGQPSLMNAPYGGEQPGSNGFQSMMENIGSQRPDVMPRGLSPSMGQSLNQPIQMDENGLEARRGAR
jgi:hypothetical protein